MRVSQITEDNLTIETIDKLLFQGLEDTGENTDCIIVLGSIKAAKYRIPVAVDAYKARRADKIVLCGGKLRDFPDGHYSEAENMRRSALDLGVAESDIILEDASQNTVENIQFALDKLQSTFGLKNIRSILLVTTAYHMRRSLAIAQHLFPKHIAVLPCPANDTNTKRDNWMNSPAGIDRAKTEALKIVHYIKSGVISDFEI